MAKQNQPETQQLTLQSMIHDLGYTPIGENVIARLDGQFGYIVFQRDISLGTSKGGKHIVAKTNPKPAPKVQEEDGEYAFYISVYRGDIH